MFAAEADINTYFYVQVGTSLTGIGELILDTDGALSLRPPSDKSQYFLSMADFETLRREYDSVATWWKALAIASTLAGAAALCWVGLRYYRHLKVRWDQEQESREFARRQTEALRLHGNEAGPDATQNGADSDTRNICVICLSQPRDCILLDCGHVCCCYVCCQSMPQRKCPICRQNVVRVLPFYQSWGTCVMTQPYDLRVLLYLTNCASFTPQRSKNDALLIGRLMRIKTYWANIFSQWGMSFWTCRKKNLRI